MIPYITYKINSYLAKNRTFFVTKYHFITNFGSQTENSCSFLFIFTQTPPQLACFAQSAVNGSVIAVKLTRNVNNEIRDILCVKLHFGCQKINAPHSLRRIGLSHGLKQAKCVPHRQKVARNLLG